MSGSRLAGKMCVVTGAAGGIGSATAELFEREGAIVAGVDLREHAVGKLPLVVDLSVEDAVAALYAGVHDRFGRVDVLFNNAGISPVDDASVLETSLEAWERVQGANLRSVFVLRARDPAAARERRGGVGHQRRLVRRRHGLGNLSDLLHRLQGRRARGVLALSRELGVEFARRGVRVNALCPGPVDTPLLRELYASDPEAPARRLVHVPMGRFAEAREIANVVLFLASDESSYVNATQFLVVGGISGAYTTPL